MADKPSTRSPVLVPWWYQLGLVFTASAATAGHMATIGDGPVPAVFSTVFVMMVAGFGARAFVESALGPAARGGGGDEEAGRAALGPALARLLAACLIATASALATVFAVRAATELEWIWAAAMGCVVFVPALLAAMAWLEARARR